jgi:UDP-N-acetylglucosamine 2-epimerase (non-hydrolysing)
LLAEGVDPAAVHVTGNTGIDAVLQVSGELAAGRLRGRRWLELEPWRKLIVVTAHRRESFGESFEQICKALARLAARPDVQIVFPVHPNPNVLEPVTARLASLPGVVLLEPLDYASFVDLMRQAHILLTDSGGVQEEGPSLGKPVLVMREKTERPEAVQAGTVKLVGTDENRIVAEAERLLDDPVEYARMQRVHNPYGDGFASARIAEAIANYFSRMA